MRREEIGEILLGLAILSIGTFASFCFLLRMSQPWHWTQDAEGYQERIKKERQLRKPLLISGR